MKILKIDTSDSKRIRISLKINESEHVLEGDVKNKSEEALILIDRLLKNNKITLKDIDEIEVNEGPGSFTGLRVGASIANAISYALGKVVNGKKGKIVVPKY